MASNSATGDVAGALPLELPPEPPPPIRVAKRPVPPLLELPELELLELPELEPEELPPLARPVVRPPDPLDPPPLRDPLDPLLDSRVAAAGAGLGGSGAGAGAAGSGAGAGTGSGAGAGTTTGAGATGAGTGAGAGVADTCGAGGAYTGGGATTGAGGVGATVATAPAVLWDEKYQPTRPPESDATKQNAMRPAAIHTAIGVRLIGTTSSVGGT